MRVTFWLVLFTLIIPLLITALIYHFRQTLKKQDHILNFWFSSIGLLVAIWFGCSAEQLSNEANNLADVSKRISENSYYYYTIEYNEKKPDENPYISQKSGLHRKLYILLKSQDFSDDEPIRVGINENRYGAESHSGQGTEISLRGDTKTEKDFFTTDSFYYYFVVGEGVNGVVQAETVVFLKDNIEDIATINKNSEFFLAMSKDDLINKKSIANIYARNYLDDKGEEKNQQNVEIIAEEINTILDKYESIQERIKKVF